MLNNQSSVSRGFALRNATAGGTAASAIASEADAGSRKKAITIAVVTDAWDLVLASTVAVTRILRESSLDSY